MDRRPGAARSEDPALLAVLLYIARPTAALPLDLDQRSVRRVFELEI